MPLKTTFLVTRVKDGSDISLEFNEIEKIVQSLRDKATSVFKTPTYEGVNEEKQRYYILEAASLIDLSNRLEDFIEHMEND